MPFKPPPPIYQYALRTLQDLTRTPPQAGIVSLLIRTALSSQAAAEYLATAPLHTRAERRDAVTGAAARIAQEADELARKTAA